jgi:hypothetical protein
VRSGSGSQENRNTSAQRISIFSTVGRIPPISDRRALPPLQFRFTNVDRIRQDEIGREDSSAQNFMRHWLAAAAQSRARRYLRRAPAFKRCASSVSTRASMSPPNRM